MNVYAWIGVIGIIFLSALPLFRESTRTREAINRFIKNGTIIALFLIAVLLFNVPLLLGLIIMLVLFILLDKKTYTKKRLIIYGVIFIGMLFLLFNFLKANPKKILTHLANNPDTTSLYIAINGEEKVTYEADTPRPLASVVKIAIALEYAYQRETGKITEEQQVSLDELERYYIKHTDGGAHEAWLDSVAENKQVKHDHVSLHTVAEGMITYSSNANTDYLIDLLGVDNINERIDELNFIDHDAVYPLVGSLLLNQQYKDAKELDKLSALSDEAYAQQAFQISEEVKQQTAGTPKDIDLTIKEQRIWSDRLPKASAKTYGNLLHKIATDTLPMEGTPIVKQLLEWPMEKVPENKELYRAVGAKGGSTAYILNQAMYIETKDDNLYEVVLFMDDLSLWQSFLLQRHINAFIVEVVNDESFLMEVMNVLE